jgi:hypothetical protein
MFVLLQILILQLIFSLVTAAFSETISSIQVVNYKKDLAYILNTPAIVVGKNYQDACSLLGSYGYKWKIIPTKSLDPACYSLSDNLVLGADTWYCADGTLAYYNIPWWYCNDLNTCPSPSWTLSSDGQHCTRKNSTCSATSTTVSEVQLIAAVVYGEASPNGSFEERAAIANALVRKSKAYGYATVNEFITRKKTQIASANNKVIRYQLVMCSDVEVEYPELYNMALNALDPDGIDYANGGCFWDGDDLKSQGTHQLHYPWGYRFTDSLHDVLGVGDTPPMNISHKNGTYDYTLESTAGYGHTVFWKYTDEFMRVRKVKQCR